MVRLSALLTGNVFSPRRR